jgi:signal transduction histidine kinase
MLGMAGDSLTGGQRQRLPADDITWQWVSGIALAATVGLAYFVAADFSVRLLVEPEGVAVFWPAAGISSGILIAFGLPAGWPALGGVVAATIATHLIIRDPLWAGVALGLCNGAEALVIAGLIHHYFGAGFGLGRIRHVISLVAVAVAGTALSGIGGAVVYRLLQGPSASMLNTWQHWFASDAVGIIAVAPLVIGLPSIVRRPPPPSEVIEGMLALGALALTTAFIISLPRELWETMFPITWLFPIFLWLAARCEPSFSAAGAFLVSMTIVWTTILGKGHFGDPSLPITDRVLGAQAGILVVAFSAYVLAALFAERRENARKLTQSYTMLERERDNKLMNIEAITAAIAHEVKQPLAAIVINGKAALRFLERSPPDHDEVRANLNNMVKDGFRTSEVFDGIRALFRKADDGLKQVDINEIIIATLQSLREEFLDHQIETRTELNSSLPPVEGHKGQLQEVISNLIHNAVDAMVATTDRSRVLHVTTELRDDDTIKLTVEDSGPGIDANKLEGIFGAFITTKSQGMGLGLAICRMIIERHKGQITASSDGKNGALFQVLLPIQSAETGVTHT